jgi:hypothetical protein
MLYFKPNVVVGWLTSSSSSSSSSARQPYVGPGLPQKLLPAEVSGYCFVRFRGKSLFQGGVVSPTPNPGYPGGPMFSVSVRISLFALA